ncbi:hypothetical protein BDK51DRAFT_48333 [Blyttiomyces helicus]|uniref:GED domain-containing protein n=1 Tax=Blyttiomyces helicus TaxID=388810 RepID=A0A4P9WH82_9FUNG|nr:hypothetical protein BDK51DRAFT_48333 [Blyttiomyces helicus]|eukprot:RKO91203.1 hypothetical protein BDK51DRAFT_48333 [Blyttiomyces helicus]
MEAACSLWKDIIFKALGDLRCTYQMGVAQNIRNYITTYGQHGLNDYYANVLEPTILTTFKDADADAQSDSLKREIVSKALDQLQNVYKTGFSGHLAPSIKVMFEDNTTKENITEAILDQLRSSLEPPLDIKSSCAKADHLASMLETYWQISSSRVLDIIIGHVDTCIVHGFVAELNLKVQDLLSDDASVLAISNKGPALKMRRESLQEMIKGLVAFKEELAALELGDI